MSSVIVLGAKGRFGRAAAQAFANAGWNVVRAGRGLSGAGTVEVDATDAAALSLVCMGHDVIVNAVHPPYTEWEGTVPRVTDAVITAARKSGATVMLPGNIYNYGNLLPNRLTERTPWVGNYRKAKIRIRMEDTYRDSGVRTIVLRAGDFIEASKSGNWFDTYIAHKAAKGQVTYPGPRDQVHAWAYLPDMARAMVGLAEQRASFEAYEEFGFGGYALTGEEMVALIEKAVERPMRVQAFPWWFLKVAQLWSPLMREVLEVRYLWERPHFVDDAKLRAQLPQFQPTPASTAIAEVLAQHTEVDVSAPVTA
ncbi:NAD-dependent epimerase/dehydratase family protein [uncultured Tateyamaria sp.]|uniref:NAD-dependent epimerase/dehydratase family protein n=1 Tax=uncultured Tateyamaria sp. TaxID=455651 RepID=UPI0026026EE2|nr:NAD-dependent epimerase/dehydratase family protein [uncultured Tateyamaria sp.]